MPLAWLLVISRLGELSNLNFDISIELHFVYKLNGKRVVIS